MQLFCKYLFFSSCCLVLHSFIFAADLPCLQEAASEPCPAVFDGQDVSGLVQESCALNCVQVDQSSICAVPEISTESKSIQVRVLLDDAAQADNKSWRFVSDSGFLIVNAKKPEQVIDLDASELLVECYNNLIHINGKKLTKGHAIIKSKTGDLFFDRKYYGGSFYVALRQQRAYLVNWVDLEEYVCSVLGAESWPSWSATDSEKIYKVLAIAIRTYCVFMMRQVNFRKRIYHLSNKIDHQVYAGVCRNRSIQDAVEQTAGLIMTYNNEPIVAMYHACCGGVVPAMIAGIDFHKAPYLERTKRCNFCQKWKKYDWVAEFGRDELGGILSQTFPAITCIKNIQISKKNKAGQVEELQVRAPSSWYTVSSKIINNLPGVKSHYYTVQLTPKKVLFKGRGCGHRIGLCQWGAYGMVKEGWSYKKVLDFYYPGVSIKKIVT